ncbi:MAG: lactate utilization protein [Lachnospiraceae bacterium]|nr:lactate utilization protein [Lachnospiraceae bacterium]
MTPKQVFYENQANTIIENLKKRQMEGYYCPTSADAVKKAMELIAKDSIVAYGGSVTLSETGILTALRERKDITFYERSGKPSEEVQKIYRDTFSCDYYFTSTNAITLDGELVNIDGNGNRVAAMIFGPANVIVVTGMNKIVTTTQEAIDRVRNIAAPPNCNRLDYKTPCASIGRCAHCFSPESICSQTVITRRSGIPGRIKILFVGEELGY